MSTYNTLLVHMDCPRCHNEVEVEIECFFGDTSEMRQFQIGEIYPWRERKAVQNGGRPTNGQLDGEGYAVCPRCERDFHALVIVKNDIIEGVAVDFERSPYLSD